MNSDTTIPATAHEGSIEFAPPLSRAPKTWLLRVVCGALTLLLTSAAWAAEESGGIVETEEELDVVEETAADQVMVLPFSGAKQKQLRERTLKALETAGFLLAPAEQGIEVELADAPEPYVEVARKHGFKAYVQADTTMSKKGWVMTLTVRNAKDGAITAQPVLKAAWLPGLLKKIDAELVNVLEAPLSQTERPPPKVELKEDSEQDDASSAEEEDMDDGARPSPFDGSVGLGMMYREMTYVDPIADVYEYPLRRALGGPGALRLLANWYPGAHFVGGLPANVGVTFGYYRSFGGSTYMATGPGQQEPFDTVFQELNIGLRGRFLELVENVELGLSVGWGTGEWTIDGDNEVPAALSGVPGAETDPGVVPDAAYDYFRLGVDGSTTVSGIPVSAGLFYRAVTLGDEPGQWSESRWFPNATAQAIEFQATGGWPLSDRWMAILGLDIRHYGLAMNSKPEEAIATDPNTGAPGLTQAVAGGANDLYLGIFAGGSFRSPEKGPSVAAEETQVTD